MLTGLVRLVRTSSVTQHQEPLPMKRRMATTDQRTESTRVNLGLGEEKALEECKKISNKVEKKVQKNNELILAHVYGFEGKPTEFFFESVKKGNMHSARYTLENGLVENVNELDEAGYTTLDYAVHIQDITSAVNEELVRYLLSKGAKLGSPNGMPVFHRSCFYNSAAFIKELHEAYKFPIDLLDNLGWTPLHVATFFGNEDVVRYLLEQGADMHLADSKNYLPICGIFEETCKDKKSAILELFLKYGMDVNGYIDGNFTLLAYAIYMDDHELVKKIVEQGAALDLHCQELSPLFIAIWKKNYEVAEFLILKGASLEPSTSQERQILDNWAQYWHLFEQLDPKLRKKDQEVVVSPTLPKKTEQE